MKPRESLARQTANELLDELGIASAPIPVDEIVRRKGLSFEQRQGFPPTVFGALFRSGSQFGIVISTACPTEGHRRFTVAHELGHYQLPGHADRLFASGGELALSMAGHFRSQKDPFEVEADLFASELLMPGRLVKPLVQRLVRGIAAVQTLATRFDTSLSAAAIRYSQIADVPTVVLVSKDGVVEWAATSPALWSHRWAKRSWRGDWAPRGSGTRRLSTAPDRVSNGAADGSTMLLCEWLEGAPGDVEAEEEALGLGSYGRVLTVISAADLRDVDDCEEEETESEEERDWRSALRPYRLG